jgi:transketolase
VRETFTRTLLEIARRDPDVLLLTGDLGFGVLTSFARELPSQFINVGVAEQNLAGLASGLAMSGHVVFIYSIANFPTLRCLEQLRNDGCYHQAAVKVVAIGGGFSYGPLGFSHHATEDLAIMRALPNMTVFCPGDLDEAEAATRALYATAGMCYLRLDKSHAPRTETADPEVLLGRVRQLRPGRDVVILGTGGVLGEALHAAESLQTLGIACGVFSVHTIKPLDVDGITSLVRSATLVVTLEEHVLDGGLGSAVAEVCADSGVYPKSFKRFGLRAGLSSVVGSQTYLRQKYHLDAEALVAGIRDTLATVGVSGDRPPGSA